MKKNNKQRLEDSLSEAINPKPKVNRLDNVHSLLDNYRAESKPPTEDENNLTSKTKSQPSTVSQVSPPSTVSTGKSSPIAPERDFQRVANSVVREVAQGIFNGKSKQMYDYLYSLTRGAISPTRKVRISKPKLMTGTGIGSPQTFYRNIKHLETLGLIKRNEIIGEWGGNEYEVFLPEEIKLKSVQLVHPVQSVKSEVKQVGLVALETELTVHTSTPINTGVSDTSKTSFKDNTKNDDEPFGAMLETLSKVSEKVSGKPPHKSDSEKWKQIAELLAMELEIAAARTKSVSNVPAFLTEHLRRRLLGKATMPKSKVSNSLQVGKANDPKAKDTEEYQAEPLSKEGRETVLKTMREYLDKGQNEFIMSFQETYTTEDWDWLTGKLKQGNSNKQP
jgi:hypothetical protein